ncbi:MAG: D-glycero-beta-D-manno-heptose-1,7-bisphosphate 7-phosphatase [Chloroflexi bacterium]|nr:MAG: D-glycero-beta-D-manno-heptose-1,7-bisphosphate 7-phosphatase [Chloroflexota bacterium]
MKAVILGRDGVINEYSDRFVKSPAEWHPIKGSLQAIASLNQAGYQVVIATNQSGLARGLFDIDTLNAIHRRLYDELDRVGGHLDGIFFCPHRPSDNCNCRKPRPGMMEQVARRFHVDLASTPVIGDSMQDLDAAQAAGARPMLVLTGRGETTGQRLPPDSAIPQFTDLAQAARHILTETIRYP